MSDLREWWFFGLIYVHGDFLCLIYLNCDFLCLIYVNGDFLCLIYLNGDFLSLIYVTGDLLCLIKKKNSGHFCSAPRFAKSTVIYTWTYIGPWI